jgi:hypothetical protein
MYCNAFSGYLGLSVINMPSFQLNFLSAIRLIVSALDRSRRNAGRLAHARSSTSSVAQYSTFILLFYVLQYMYIPNVE